MHIKLSVCKFCDIGGDEILILYLISFLKKTTSPMPIIQRISDEPTTSKSHQNFPQGTDSHLIIKKKILMLI